MSNPWRVEATLQSWQPWAQSIQIARHDLRLQPDFTEQEFARWEKKVGWYTVWSRAREELDALILPRALAQYWVACLCSDYDPGKPGTYYRIKLPERVTREIFADGIPGSSLIFFEGSTARYPVVEGSEVKIKIKGEGEGERILPSFPMEFAVPSPLGFPIGIGAQKPHDVLLILPPPWTKICIQRPYPGPPPPKVSPYLTIRIPLFALGYSQPLFRQLNSQVRAIAEWLATTKMHPLHSGMRRGRPASYYREWAIEQIEQAEDKVEAFHKVCEVLLLIEKAQEKKRESAGRGRAERRYDLTRRGEDVIKAAIRRRVQKWLKQVAIQPR